MLNGIGAHKALFSCFVKDVYDGNNFRLVTRCGLIRKKRILKAEWLLWVYTICVIHVKFREDRSAG